MKKSEIVNILQDSIINRKLIDIFRNKITSDSSLQGVPLILSPKLLMIQHVYDFVLDGFKIIKLNNISEVLLGEEEAFYEYILIKEKVYNQMNMPSISCIDDWKFVLKNLITSGKNIIVECEDNVDEKFYIGKIINVNNKYIDFLGFNSIGKWDDMPTKIIYKNITSISFDNNYTNIISKYVKGN